MYQMILWIFRDELRTAGCHLWPVQKDPTLLTGLAVTYVSGMEHMLRENKGTQIYLPYRQAFEPLWMNILY